MFKVKDWFSSRSWKRLVQCVFETSRRYSDILKQGKNLFLYNFEGVFAVKRLFLAKKKGAIF